MQPVFHLSFFNFSEDLYSRYHKTMPELPEVETVCRGLAPHIVGASIKTVKVFCQKLRIDVPKNLAKKLKNKTIVSVERKAKYILLILDSDEVFIVHLGMTGRLTVNNNSDEKVFKNKVINRARHDHILIELNNNCYLTFNDTRRFGLVFLTTMKKLNSSKLFAKLGLEPFSEQFTPESFYELCKKRNRSIKSVIMDSKLVVGVGNIYASESLFLAGIHPEKIAAKISKKKIEDLYHAIIETLEKAILAGGSTLKDFANADGNAGYFQNELLVYDKAGLLCLQCENRIERIMQNGRSSFFCRRCQRK